jgi:hypothetical protein
VGPHWLAYGGTAKGNPWEERIWGDTWKTPCGDPLMAANGETALEGTKWTELRGKELLEWAMCRQLYGGTTDRDAFGDP